MRQLLPEPIDDVDPVALYTADVWVPPEPGTRPWLLVNMIASVDGATAVDGRSGGLGSEADHTIFHAIRSVADVILVAAGTARIEGYGPAAAPSGGGVAPRVAVVTGSADLDPASGLFANADPAALPIVLTVSSAPADRRARLGEVAEVVVAGEDRVDVRLAVAALAERGAGVVLCEGGPSLNGQLVHAGLVDEWCQSFAPCLAGGPSARVAVGDELAWGPIALRLARLLEQDGMLFSRYVRR